jgi:hypothetical protein
VRHGKFGVYLECGNRQLVHRHELERFTWAADRETSTVTINNGGTANIDTGAAVSLIATIDGGSSVSVAGVGQSWTLSGTGQFGAIPLVVGDTGTGALTITNGGAVATTGNVGNVVISSTGGGAGTVTVGSALAPNLANTSTLTFSGDPNNAGALFVGDTGNGTLIINSDGAVSGFITAILADGVGSHGTVTVNRRQSCCYQRGGCW